jgi:hypothetical protein
MRATASVGFLAEGADGKFSQTPMSELLCTDAKPSLRHAAMFLADDWHVRGWGQLADTVRTGERPVEKIYGLPVFEYFAKNPEDGATFNGAMTNLSSMDAPLIVEAYDFSGIGTLADIAGGHGLLLASVLNRHPAMKGILYDLPQVTQTLAGGPIEAVRDRVRVETGDMFQSVPKGADAYMMKFIIHDWPDDKSITLLKHCRAGVNPGGRLLVVDMVVPRPNQFHFSNFADLEMMLFPSGKERTADEFRALLAASGWKLNRIVPTAGNMSIIEGVPA